MLVEITLLLFVMEIKDKMFNTIEPWRTTDNMLFWFDHVTQ